MIPVLHRKNVSQCCIIIILAFGWLDSFRPRDGSTLNAVHSAVDAAFVPRPTCHHQLYRRCYQSTNGMNRIVMMNQSSSSVGDPSQAQHEEQQQQPALEERTIVDRSTLVLLEHINLNVPTQSLILPFYFQVLGCGMDPRKVENLNLNPQAPKKTLWANAGATQFHLPYGEVAQCIPGQIGLRYDSLQGLEQRLQQYPQAYQSSQVLENGNCIQLVDHYGNVFYCRAPAAGSSSRVSSEWKQPILARHHDDNNDASDDNGSNDNIPTWKKEAMALYGRDDGMTDCRGIDYVEFQCPMGTAEKIALFYSSVFDATTFCLETGDDDDNHDNDTDNDQTNKARVAIIAIGKIDAQGRADQTLLFRETHQANIPNYDGHHIAMYIGTSAADFEQAFRNAQLANIVWVNPRFKDQARTVQEAVQQWKQFRFKNIVDMETGATILELEHEMRSIQHEAWPGPRPMIPDY